MNERDIYIMDKILKFQFDNGNDWQNYDELQSVLLAELKINEDRFQYYINEISKFSESTTTICNTLTPYNDGEYPIFECNESTKIFLENGGFKGYWDRLKGIESKPQRVFSKEFSTEFGGVATPIACPFTNTPVNAKIENDVSEYNLKYNNNDFVLRIKEIDKVRTVLTESNRWIFQGMLFNNEWQIEKETLITPTLIDHITRLADYPKDFEAKCDYFLLKCYKNGGAVAKDVEFNAVDFLDAYCENKDEFNRVLKFSTTNHYIDFKYQLTDKGYISFLESGLKHAKELSKIEEDKKPKKLYPAPSPKVLIISTKDDYPFVQKVQEFLFLYGFSVSYTESISGEKHSSTFNAEKAIEDESNNYVIFIKSQSSESNKAFGLLENTAMVLHKKTERIKHHFLYFAAIDDGPPFDFPNHYTYYFDTLFDFRIISNRRRLAIDILKDWANITGDSNINEVEKLNSESNFRFPLVKLNELDDFWLKEMYKRFKEDKEEYYGSITPLYWETMPQYDPLKIHAAVLENGSYITFYGIWLIDPDSPFVKGVLECILAIRKILMRDGNKHEIHSDEVQKISLLPNDIVLKSLKLLGRFGEFIQIFSTGGNQVAFHIEQNKGLERFKSFKSLEAILRERFPNLEDELPLFDDIRRIGNEYLIESHKESDFKRHPSFKPPIILKDRELEAVMGVKELAKDIAEIIDQPPTEQDQMIGVFGRWGRGKTVFISELKNRLESSKKIKYHILEYRAWKYQETPASWAYLYELLADKYYDKPKNFILKELFSKTGYWVYWKKVLRLNRERNGFVPLLKFIGSFLLSASISYGLLKRSDISAWMGIPVVVVTWLAFLRKTIHQYGHNAHDLIKKYGIKHSYKDTMGLQAEIQKEIIKLFNTWIPKDKNGEKIALIVEDIDRCTEEKILQNIDSLRVMLEDPEIINRLVIITAIDDTILKRAVKSKYEKLNEGEEYKKELDKIVAEYLDKVFLMAIKLGTLSTKNKEEFLEVLLKNQVEELVKESTEPSSAIKEEKTNSINSPEFRLKTPPYYIVENPEQTNETGDTVHQFSSKEIPKQTKPIETENINGIRKLLPVEADHIKKAMMNWKDSTPRKMRIFYYRYLLCKLLLFNRYPKVGQSNVWQSPEGIKYLLDLMLVYIDSNNPKLISVDKNSIENMNDGRITLTRIVPSPRIDKDDCINLLEVLELVIAY